MHIAKQRCTQDLSSFYLLCPCFDHISVVFTNEKWSQSLNNNEQPNINAMNPFEKLLYIQVSLYGMCLCIYLIR